MGKIGFNNNRKILRKTFPKRKRIYSLKNRKECLRLDPNCKRCGSNSEVSAHHIRYKSEGLDDSMHNLITLCFECHRVAHDGVAFYRNGKRIFISPKDFMLETLEKISGDRYEKAIIWLKSKKK